MPKPLDWTKAPRFKIKGDAETRAALRTLGKTLKRTIIVKAMKAAMVPVLARAKSEVDVRTGRTRSALEIVVRGEEKGRMKVDVALRKVKWGAFEEYGVKSKNRPPEGALLRAYVAERDRAATSAARDIASATEREASHL